MVERTKRATAAEPAKKAGPAPSDDEPPVPTPVEEHKAEPQMSEIAPAAARPLLAISIDILAAKPAQAKSIDP